MVKAFSLPKITCTDLDYENISLVLEQIKNAKSVITFFENQDGEDKVLFSGLGEREFTSTLMSIHRNVFLYDFFKTMIITIDQFREDPNNGHDFAIKAIEYIKLKNKTNAF